MAGGKKDISCRGSYRDHFFIDEDYNDKTLDSGYDLDIISDSENERDSESSDLDMQTEGLKIQKSNKAESLTVRKCNKIVL